VHPASGVSLPLLPFLCSLLHFDCISLPFFPSVPRVLHTYLPAYSLLGSICSLAVQRGLNCLWMWWKHQLFRDNWDKLVGLHLVCNYSPPRPLSVSSSIMFLSFCKPTLCIRFPCHTQYLFFFIWATFEYTFPFMFMLVGMGLCIQWCSELHMYFVNTGDFGTARRRLGLPRHFVDKSVHCQFIVFDSECIHSQGTDGYISAWMLAWLYFCATGSF
jgi:hypothetical protein